MLMVGYSREEFRLEKPVKIIWAIDKVSERQLTPVCAFATVFESAGKKGAFITLDLLGVHHKFTQKIREVLKAKGFSPELVSFTATHSHTTPLFCNFTGFPGEPEVNSEVERACIKAVKNADKDMQEAVFMSAVTKCSLNLNRRQKGRMSEINSLDIDSGDVDDDLGIMVFRREKGDIILVNYAMHSLTMGHANVIHGDFPYEMAKYLEKEIPGIKAQFIQGPCGSLNPKINGSEKICAEAGRIVAESALKGIKNLEEISVTGLEGKLKEFELPCDMEATMKALEISKKRENPHLAEKCWIKEIEEAGPQDSIKMRGEVQRISLGDFKIVFLPGESFHHTALKLKENNGVNMVAGYSNSCEVGYIPVKEAFPEGGYEPDISYKYYSRWKYQPCVEEILYESAKAVL